MRLIAVAVATVGIFFAALALMPSTAFGVACSSFPNQAAAQAAANTRDPDGDGVYCESLPCPCSTATSGGGSSSPTPVAPADPAPTPASDGTSPAGCATPSVVQSLTFSSAKYPNILNHVRAAIRKGWPKVLTINRDGADQRRDRLLQGMPTRPGFDRDEYPPAVARGTGAATRGTDPTGWMASVQYVPNRENRSHGATMGAALRKFCNGVRFRYVFE